MSKTHSGFGRYGLYARDYWARLHSYSQEHSLTIRALIVNPYQSTVSLVLYESMSRVLSSRLGYKPFLHMLYSPHLTPFKVSDSDETAVTLDDRNNLWEFYLLFPQDTINFYTISFCPCCIKSLRCSCRWRLNWNELLRNR